MYQENLKPNKTKGLSHSDAEDVIPPSSPYKGTAEGGSAAKNTHKILKSVRISTLKTAFSIFSTEKAVRFSLILLVCFCSALNESAPLVLLLYTLVFVIVSVVWAGLMLLCQKTNHLNLI